ncbi:MAG: CCDC90 family protein [Candidatus Magnetominusculus sp. LBB02]|nr:CCDC90 family protein [Candidatus Magnetominusculus sp. LBB02]
MVTAIDTLKIYERLRDAELSDRAAKEIAEVFREFIEERLATKRDIEVTKSALKADIDLAKTEIKADLELKIESIRADLDAKIESTKTEIATSKAETLKWIFLFWAGQLFAIFAMFKSFIK